VRLKYSEFVQDPLGRLAKENREKEGRKHHYDEYTLKIMKSMGKGPKGGEID